MLLTVVEGPKGKAELYEVPGPEKQPVYEVRHGGKKETFVTMGEAYLVASEKVAGKP